MRLMTSPLVPPSLKFNYWRGHKLTLNEGCDGLQKMVDAALRKMAAEEGNGYEPQVRNHTELCGRTGFTRS